MSIATLSEKTQKPATILSDCSGRGTTWALFFCLAATIWYLKIGQPFFAEHLAPIHHTLVLITLGIIVLFTIGCCLQMILMGDKTNGQLRRDLRRQVQELEAFVNDSTKQIREYEALALQNVRCIRPGCLNAIGNNRRIISALQKRALDIRTLLASRNQIDLIDAYELLNQNLEVVENCVDTLIGADPIPPIEPNKWLATVEALFKQIDGDLQRIAA